MRTLRRRTAAIGAAVAIVGTAVAVPALAQSDTSDGTAEAAAAFDQHQAHHADRKAAFAEALATELDLPVDEVVAALDAVHEDLHAARAEAADAVLEERLADAVEDGELTEQQADAIRDAREAGVLGGHGRGHLGGHGGRGHHGRPAHHGGVFAPDDRDGTDATA